MPSLYHFTPLFYLPEITREGITRGDVPLGPFQSEQAPNLTSNPNPLAQRWSDGNLINKVRARLAVNIPDGDPKLEPWRSVCKRCKVPREWQRALDPTGQGKFWYVYWGVIPSEWFDVELWQGSDYQLLSPEALSSLIRDIEHERQKFTVTTLPQGLRAIDLKTGAQESWLLDGDMTEFGIGHR